MQYRISATRLACLVLAIVLCSVNLAAQQSATDASEPPNPVLKMSPEKALESFEPPLNEEYTLGAGDEISLDFAGRPEMARKHVIGPDGRITLQTGPVKIADLTRDAAAKAITDALASYYTNLAVTVTIDKYSANSVRVMGYVQHPGEIRFEETP